MLTAVPSVGKPNLSLRYIMILAFAPSVAYLCYWLLLGAKNHSLDETFFSVYSVAAAVCYGIALVSSLRRRPFQPWDFLIAAVTVFLLLSQTSHIVNRVVDYAQGCRRYVVSTGPLTDTVVRVCTTADAANFHTQLDPYNEAEPY